MSVAVTGSPRSSQSDESSNSGTNWTRYLAPTTAFHVRVTMPLDTIMELITGGGRTMAVKVLASLSGGKPSSVTTTVMELVVLTCSGAGVQVKTPLEELMAAPGGALLNAYASRLAGRSTSVAWLVKVSVAPWCTNI